MAFEGVDNRLVSVDVPNLEDGLWHTATILFADPLITVTLDGDDLITGAALPGYTPFTGYFGFSAATGAATNEQRVDDIRVDTRSVERIYVDADATGGADDGTTWADAYLHLQDALDTANADCTVYYELDIGEFRQ